MIVRENMVEPLRAAGRSWCLARPDICFSGKDKFPVARAPDSRENAAPRTMTANFAHVGDVIMGNGTVESPALP